MFQSIKRSKKCNFNQLVFKDCIIIRIFKLKTNNNLDIASILRQVISSYTIGFTWKFFLDNGTTRNHNFLTKNFSKKNPIWFFCLHVQLDQNVILDKSIWI
jgi:hypothetical protein